MEYLMGRCGRPAIGSVTFSQLVWNSRTFDPFISYNTRDQLLLCALKKRAGVCGNADVRQKHADAEPRIVNLMSEPFSPHSGLLVNDSMSERHGVGLTVLEMPISLTGAAE